MRKGVSGEKVMQLCNAYKRKDWKSVVDIFRVLHTTKRSKNADVCKYAILAYGRLGMFDKSLLVFKNIDRLNLVKDTNICNALLNAASFGRVTDDVLHTLEIFENEKFKPNLLILKTLGSIAEKMGDESILQKVVYNMTTHRIPPDEELLTIIMKCYIKCGRVTDSFLLMKNYAININIFNENMFEINIIACSNKGMFDEALELIGLNVQANLHVTHESLSCLCIEAAKTGSLLEVLKTLNSLDLEIRATTCNKVLAVLLRKGDLITAKALYEMAVELGLDINCKNEILYRKSIKN